MKYNSNDWFKYTYSGTNSDISMVHSAKLMLDNNDRSSYRNSDFFNLVTPYKYAKRAPDNIGINLYSFGIYPSLDISSGFCNFSDIESSNLLFKMNKSSIENTDNSENNKCYIRIYATNYNILKIKNGNASVIYKTH